MMVSLASVMRRLTQSESHHYFNIIRSSRFNMAGLFALQKSRRQSTTGMQIVEVNVTIG